MRRSSILIVGLILLLLIPSATAGIANLSTDVGTSYISWEWNYTNNITQVAVWIDGIHETNTNLQFYILEDIAPREQHSIGLTNVSNSSELFGTSSVKTFYPPFIFYILFLFGISFLMLTIFLKPFVISIVVGTLGFIISLSAFYFSYPMHFAILSYLCLAIAVLCMIWILGKMFVNLTKVEEDLEII